MKNFVSLPEPHPASRTFKKTEMFAEVKVERLVEENGYYDPLFAVIGKKGEY